MPDINSDVPPWLAARYAPSQQSPWILDAIRLATQREEMKRKLPLQLQGMALENRAHALAIEHQAILNDVQNQEMRAFAEDLPTYREAIETATKTPGGSASMGTPPFKSKRALDLWQERQKSDAATAYGQAIHQATIADYKAVTEAMQITGDTIRPAANGQFNPEEKVALLNKARAMKRSETREDAASKDPLALRTEYLTTLRQELDSATAGGDAAAIAAAKAKLETALSSPLAIPTNETIETGMDAEGHPTVKITRGKQAGAAAASDALTTSGKTKVQEGQAQSLATIDIANRLDPLINEETVGLKATLGSWVNDRILAQAFPRLINEDRVKAERLVAELRSKAVNELGTPPISDRERAEILKAVPGINDPVDSPARAKQLLAQIKKMSAIRALVAAKRLGGTLPKSAATALDDETLVDLFKQGLITQEQAKAAYQMKRQ